MTPSGTRFALRFLAVASLLLLGVTVARPSWTGHLGSAPLQAQAAPSYSIIQLGTLPGGGPSAALAVNATGQVTGYAVTARGSHAFLWERVGGMRDLGTLPGDSQSYGMGINANGEVCGISQGSRSRAFVWSKTGGMRALAPLLSGTETWAYGINAAGQVAGSSGYLDAGKPGRSAVVWDRAGAIQALPPVARSGNGTATAINDLGQAAGYQQITEVVAGRAFIRDQPFVWTAAEGLKLLTASNGRGGRPLANNAAGQVLGSANAAGTPTGFPVSWAPEGARVLDSVNPLAAAGPFQQELGGINSAGRMVYSLFSAKLRASVATLNQGGAAVDLNTRVAAGAAVHLYTAAAINDRDQIVGALGNRNGTQLRAYLLTPVAAVTQRTVGPLAVGPLAAPEAPVNLGTAGNFTILAKAGISNTGPTNIVGDIGVSPISSAAITGFALVPPVPIPGITVFATSPFVVGKVFAADYANPTPAMLTTAVLDMEAAYLNAEGRINPNTINLGAPPGNIGGLNIAPGLHKFTVNVTIPTDVTLTGGASDVFIFQIAGTLDLAVNTRIILAGGARPENIFWQVSGAVTLGTDSVFNGIILAKTNIAAQTRAVLNGRALAQTAVTLDSVRFTAPLAPPPPVPPTITCPPDVTVNTTPGLCTASGVALGTPTTTGVGVVVTNNAPVTFPLGVTVVTFTATNADGIATCQQRVTVRDAQAPTISCPANITVPTTPNQCSAPVAFNPTATDNCPGVSVSSVPPSGSTFQRGTTTVTSTATDASGNTASCSFTVTVVDTQRPTITCPANITAPNTANQCLATVNFTTTASDNCPGVSVSSVPASGSIFPLGATTVTSTATDAAGNTASCSFTVTVVDTQRPTITCPANITVPNAANQCSAPVGFAVTAADNCPGVSVSSTPASGSTFAVGTTTVTSTATDAAGNTATCSFTVTVNDVQAPVISCPANITVPNDPNQCAATVAFNPTATDNCPGVSVSSVPASGSSFPRGTTTVTSTATDGSGNTATCSFTVTVIDTQLPVISCPANITVPTALDQCSAPVAYNPTATDNCPGVVVVSVPPSGSTFQRGTTTVTSTATDASGNTATCSFTVTVVDTQPPVVTVPANITRPAEFGVCSAIVNIGLATATDNCPGVTVNRVRSDGLALAARYPLGVTVITATATDTSGNTANAAYTVTILDLQNPRLTVPLNITARTTAWGANSVAVNIGLPVATDNCPGVVMNSVRSDGLALTAPYPVGPTIITVTATDTSGNFIIKRYVVTVLRCARR